MSVNKPDISLIEKYLNGELDARAMHELERQALDDPFLADALEGYAQKPVSSAAHLNDLHKRLQQRIQPERKRLELFAKLSIAATVLIVIGVGSWYWLFNQPLASVKDMPVADKTAVVKTPPARIAKPAPQVIQPELKPTTPQWGATKLSLKTKRAKTHLLADAKMDSTSAVLAKLKADSGNNVLPGRANLVAANSKVKQKDKTNLGRRLDEVVVVGYGTQRKQTITGAVSTVQSETMNASVASMEPQNIEAALAGKVAGVAISPSRKRNSPEKIQIRGLSSINKNQPPLYIVDGKLVDKIDDINPDHVASINVIKDSSATAIYGSRATNGVVIIKTKSTSLIRGQVVSADDQLPLPGVMVKVKGTNKAVATDIEGKFKIDADKNAALVFTYIGFDTQEQKVKEAKNLKVALKANTKTLSEVVITTNENNTERYEKAQPVNGWKAFHNYLKEKAQSPDSKTGVVKVSFTVNADETASDIKITKSLSAEADAKAIELIKNYQGWTANSDGKPETVKVKVRFNKP
ncbi:carboxypeptidase-like regulatory domain-containing protein [Mucilaginibacter sp. CSA2-8R]|uniref:carboxypeptidase-like regulatory domain-containing protein n=1 Tax=Mucilaginibacter sp. CSA2-8R TaxID=3141542 RepID=UPI00315CFD14